jgi:hypothetical protein
MIGQGCLEAGDPFGRVRAEQDEEGFHRSIMSLPTAPGNRRKNPAHRYFSVWRYIPPPHESAI